MASKARLDRLRDRHQADLDALPDRAPEPVFTDSDASGGVPLSPVDALSKQTTADDVQPEPAAAANTERRFVWLNDAESSYNPAALPAPHTAPATKPAKPVPPLPAHDLNRGDLGSATQHYTPIIALSKYPYKWCDKTHAQDIASAFFDQGKFWAREWDLYYVWDIDNHAKPLILVRETQVQQLLGQINDHLHLALRITDQQRDEALVSRFPDHPRCTPRYLGRSRSREEYDNMVDNAPTHDFRAAGEPSGPPLDDLRLETFRQLMEESFEAQKAKNKTAKAKKQQERLLKQKTLSDQFKRAQRYLGLRPNAEVNASASSGQPPAIDPTLPAPFVFDQSVVFVCVDVESFERAHHKITEVGIATLDTTDLAKVAPGVDGENWRRLIRARHFRIRENAHLVNSVFVQGCPDRFYFGKSTTVPLAEAPTHVAACFSPPFGAHESNGVENVLDLHPTETRNTIFLGHDTLGDVRYLQHLGFDPLKIDGLLEALDTAVMYRVWRRELNPTALGRILNDFDIAGFGLHNAGNDAVYTVQAMLAICVREATMRESAELSSMRSSDKSARLAAALEEAQQKANDEAAGWSDHEVDGDGGAPVPLSVETSKLAPSNGSSEVPTSANTRGAFRGRGRGRGSLPSASHASEGQHDRHNHGLARGRGRADRGQHSGLRSYTRGGHIEDTSREHGRGRGRGASSTTTDDNGQSPQVRSIDLS
ncbi:QDE-2-interacting protein [Stagonosporopsis vannaccii]|nr:QDE-2-interacting protein [Stagonosporopsis vannaccii]